MSEPTRFNEPEGLTVGSFSTRLEFDTDHIRSFSENRGIEVLWEKSYLCTCRNRMTGAPNASCPICHGRGIAYLPAKRDTMIIQSQEKGLTNGDLGLYDSGTAIGTSRTDSLMTFRDRISIPDVSIGHSLIFDVTQRRIDKGMWLSYDVKELTYAVTDNGVILVPDQDYTVDYEKNLFFPNQSLLDKNVSLNLTSTLRYIIIDLLKESRYQYTNKDQATEKFENLPKKLLLKREDAWVNPTPFSLDEATEKEYDTTTEDPKRNSTLGGFFGGGLNG